MAEIKKEIVIGKSHETVEAMSKPVIGRDESKKG